jgi:beta-glucosidase
MKYLIAWAALFAGAIADDLSKAVYKNPKASVEDRVEDLLRRMTVQDKVSQIVQGDIANWINFNDNSFNQTGLEWSMATRGGTFYIGPYTQDKVSVVVDGIEKGQDYLMHNTTLGIPALVQSEGIHGFVLGMEFPISPAEIPIEYQLIMHRKWHYLQLANCICMLLEY